MPPPQPGPRPGPGAGATGSGLHGYGGQAQAAQHYQLEAQVPVGASQWAWHRGVMMPQKPQPEAGSGGNGARGHPAPPGQASVSAGLGPGMPGHLHPMTTASATAIAAAVGGYRIGGTGQSVELPARGWRGVSHLGAASHGACSTHWHGEEPEPSGKVDLGPGLALRLGTVGCRPTVTVTPHTGDDGPGAGTGARAVVASRSIVMVGASLGATEPEAQLEDGDRCDSDRSHRCTIGGLQVVLMQWLSRCSDATYNMSW
jgi:hypothetical protein